MLNDHLHLLGSVEIFCAIRNVLILQRLCCNDTQHINLFLIRFVVYTLCNDTDYILQKNDMHVVGK